MIARISDGLPLAEGLDRDDDPELRQYDYKSQAKASAGTKFGTSEACVSTVQLHVQLVSAAAFSAALLWVISIVCSYLGAPSAICSCCEACSAASKSMQCSTSLRSFNGSNIRQQQLHLHGTAKLLLAHAAQQILPHHACWLHHDTI
jgi:hypothetical protein